MNKYYSILAMAISLVIMMITSFNSGVSAAPTPLTMSQRVSLQLAVSNAIKAMHSSTQWKYVLSSASIEYSNIQHCEPVAGYPPTLDLPDNNKFIICKNNDATLPWVTSNTTGYYFTFADMVQQELMGQYKKNFEIEWVDVDVSKSYFEPLRDAVNNDMCHMVVSYTIVNANRSRDVDFGCSHSAGRSSILRSGLEPERVLDTLEKLNDTSVNVGYVRGSANLRPQAANLVQVDSITEGFTMIKNQTLHAILWSEVTTNNWAKKHCSECKIHPYGNVVQYAIFFKQGTEMPNTAVSSMLSGGNRYAVWMMATLSTIVFAMLF